MIISIRYQSPDGKRIAVVRRTADGWAVVTTSKTKGFVRVVTRMTAAQQVAREWCK